MQREVLLMNASVRQIFIRGVLVFCWVVFSHFAQAETSSDRSFQSWIHTFRAEALRQGIRPDIYDRAFREVNTPDDVVLEKAHYQPEFRTEAWEYMDNRVQDRSINTGRDMLRQYSNVLQSIERNSGVSRYVLLAIWSMESGYGAALKKPDSLHYIPRALGMDDRIGSIEKGKCA
ncbi:MAG TPA: lytic murein transglycosylase, partial [Pseudomonadales bacterium]|nr:lytic murein transglycosylase [Pseudomonadales bacterium]